MNARFVYSHPLVAVCVFFIRDMNTVTENTHVQLFLDTCFHFSMSGDAESQDSPVHSFLKNFGAVLQSLSHFLKFSQHRKKVLACTLFFGLPGRYEVVFTGFFFCLFCAGC